MSDINSKSVYVIIPAGGSGSRFGGNRKKQFLKLNDDTILNNTIKKFLSLAYVSKVVVALPSEALDDQQKSLSHKKLNYVQGGSSRAESVRNGFDSLTGLGPDDVILVHDGVRPLVSEEVIENVVFGIQDYGAAIPVAKVTDTIKMIENGYVKDTIDRNLLGAAQTPQGASYNKFKEAYLKAGNFFSEFTDEAMLFENCEMKVGAVSGDQKNIKITTQFDLDLAKLILSYED